MTSVTTEPLTHHSIPSISSSSTTAAAAAAGLTASQRRSYSCYDCNYSFHIIPTATTSPSSPSSFRCPRCHHRHLIPHHTISPPLPPMAPTVIPLRYPDYAPAPSSFVNQTSDDEDFDYGDYDSDNSLPSLTAPDLIPFASASEPIADSLPTKKISPNSTPVLKSCSICMEDFEVNSDTLATVNKLPCEHYFHKHCIDEWLKRRNTCPLCRFKLPVDPIPEERTDTSHWDVGFGGVFINLALAAEEIVRQHYREESFSAEANRLAMVSAAAGQILRLFNREESFSTEANPINSGPDTGGLSVNVGEITSWNFEPMRDEDGDTLMMDA